MKEASQMEYLWFQPGYQKLDSIGNKTKQKKSQAVSTKHSVVWEPWLQLTLQRLGPRRDKQAAVWLPSGLDAELTQTHELPSNQCHVHTTAYYAKYLPGVLIWNMAHKCTLIKLMLYCYLVGILNIILFHKFHMANLFIWCHRASQSNSCPWLNGEQPHFTILTNNCNTKYFIVRKVKVLAYLCTIVLLKSFVNVYKGHCLQWTGHKKYPSE